MTDRLAARQAMILDACVLIDFLKADAGVLRSVAKLMGPVYVASPVVEEVSDIEDEDEAFEFGLTVIEPEIEDAFAAANQLGPTSFQDRLCVLVAKRHGFVCVTNDKNLRKLCRREGVPVLWGLELLGRLHEAGGIPGNEARAIAEAIRRSNPKHITAQIVSRFRDIIRRQEAERRRP